MMIIDSRENTKQPQLCGAISKAVNTTVKSLSSADFAFVDAEGQTVGIERKEIQNLLNDLRNGRLEDELQRCLSEYNNVILLVEGVFTIGTDGVAIYKRSKNSRYFWLSHIYPFPSPRGLYEAIDRVGDYGVAVRYSTGLDDSADVILSIYKGRRKPNEQRKLMNRTVRQRKVPLYTTDPYVKLLINAIPRLPEKTAKALVKQFGTPIAVFSASEMELMKVEGVGKGIVENIRKAVG